MKLLGRFGHNTIVGNSFWLLLDKFFGLGMGFVTTIILTRQFGAQAFGQYSYLISFVALCAPLFSLGMARILLREFSLAPDKIGIYLTTSCYARFASSGFFSLIALAVFAGLSGEGFESGSGLLSLAVLLLAQLSSGFEVYEFWFQHQSLNRPLVKLRIGAAILFNLLKIAVALVEPRVLWLAMVLALEWVAIKSAYYLLYRHYTRAVGQPHYFDLEAFKNLFEQSKYLILSGIGAVIYLNIDMLMLQHLVSSSEVGLYAVAAKLSQVWFVVPAVLVTAISPQMLKWAKDHPDKYRQRSQALFSLLFWLALVATLATYWLAPYLVPWLFGAQYLPSVAILQLHIWALVFISMRCLFSHILVIMKFAQFSLVSQLSGALINVLLNLILIPSYQGQGAAVATIVSYAVSSYFCLLLSGRTRPVFVMMSKAVWPGYVLDLFTKTK